MLPTIISSNCTEMGTSYQETASLRRTNTKPPGRFTSLSNDKGTLTLKNTKPS